MKCLPLALAAAVAALILALSGCSPAGGLRATDLRCEFRENPTGIGTTRPRLSWKLQPVGTATDAPAQTAFRVVAAPSAQALQNGDYSWDTGLQPGRDQLSIEYAGPPLDSRSQLHWRVLVVDSDDRSAGWSGNGQLSIGLLRREDWHARWIGLDAQPQPPLTEELRASLRSQPWIRLPGPPERTPRHATFLSTFDLPSPPTSAFLVGTADQICLVEVNDTPQGELTRWDMIHPIDISRTLRAGPNSVRLAVRNDDGFPPAVTGAVLITFADGSSRRINVDQSFAIQSPADRAGQPPELSGSQPWGGARNTEHFMSPVVNLNKTFTTYPARPVRRATLYSTALGLYSPSINGFAPSHDAFAPGWTEYTKRVYHQTYDVTRLIIPGANVISFDLGDGWFAGLLGYTGRRHFYGGPARLLAQLEIEYADGSTQIIPTDESWSGRFTPYTYADLYLGCHFDAAAAARDASSALSGNPTPGLPVAVGLPSAVPARTSDVTERVRAILSTLGSIRPAPLSLGDPAYGVVKRLTLDLEGDRRIIVREGDSISLADLAAPVSAIKRATWGEPQPAGISEDSINVQPQPGEPVTTHERIPAIARSEPRPGRYVYDLGQNIVGWVQLRDINGREGQRLTVRHAEMLNPDGTLYTSNLRGATATDFYTLASGLQTLEPIFTFHGFRYVEITGTDAPPEPANVIGIVAHTRMQPTGTFTSSNSLLNQLVHNIVWGQKGNYLEVPTDCPQRDERLGWTGDAQFFINAAAFNFDIASFMSRWLTTLAQDSQFDDGRFAHVAPKVDPGGGSTAWGDAAIVCAHSLFWTYGDTRVISDNYDAFARYIAWLDTKTTDGIAKVGGFGDWLNLGDPTSQDLIDTAFRAELLRMMAEMGRVIGKETDAQRYEASRAQTVEAFRRRFVAADGSLRDSGQTGYALVFTMPGLLTDPQLALAAPHFANAIAAKGGKLATGFIGTPRLLPALFSARLDALAGSLLLNEEYPGWLYQVKLGATTMWERWDGWTPDRGFQDVGMNSFNHYAFGSVGDALYRFVAGISPLDPGYATIQLAPRPIPNLDHAAASYDSIRGTIRSSYQKHPDRTEFRFSVPPGTRAVIRLPSGTSHVVGPGEWSFSE
jgi:alpha-L-rhamnosidase